MLTSGAVVQIFVSDKANEIISLAHIYPGTGDSTREMTRRASSVANEMVAVVIVPSLVRKSQVDVSKKRPLQCSVVFASDDVARDGNVTIFFRRKRRSAIS